VNFKVEFNIKEGIQNTKEIKVTENDTAIKMGSGDLEVYATPSMVALMENAAKNSVSKVLPEGYTTVGIDMSVKHIKSSPVGASIKCTATLIKVDRKKLFFDIEASDEKGIIGKATHIRYIVNSNEFMEKTRCN
jgi:fluoroacetyl-CoA thioesterase